MKIIEEGYENNSMEKEVTCKLCGAKLEITPKDCERAENDLNFWVECASCQKNCNFHIRDVGPLFWLKMNVYGNDK